jgi:uncharacterized protein YndB with AHSA1/START domain
MGRLTVTSSSGGAARSRLSAGRDRRGRSRGRQAALRVLLAAGLATGVYGLAVRPWHLRWGATDAEIARPMPDDDLVDRPQLNATRAITIDAPPYEVWPWLVQMGGYTRAGWYSYDRIDNAGRPSAWRIHPELQHLEVGDILPTDPDGRGFEVHAIDPERSLVLGIHAPDRALISTAITLQPQRGGRTRLVFRLRQRAPSWRGWPFLAAMDIGDVVMMRRTLLGIRARAEHAHRDPSPSTAPARDPGGAACTCRQRHRVTARAPTSSDSPGSATCSRWTRAMT